MLSEIESWRKHESSGRFDGGRPHEEEANKPISVVADTGKHPAVRSYLRCLQQRFSDLESKSKIGINDCRPRTVLHYMNWSRF
jgi:hypothetical protein